MEEAEAEAGRRWPTRPELEAADKAREAAETAERGLAGRPGKVGGEEAPPPGLAPAPAGEHSPGSEPESRASPTLPPGSPARPPAWLGACGFGDREDGEEAVAAASAARSRAISAWASNASAEARAASWETEGMWAQEGAGAVGQAELLSSSWRGHNARCQEKRIART